MSIGKSHTMFTIGSNQNVTETNVNCARDASFGDTRSVHYVYGILNT